MMDSTDMLRRRLQRFNKSFNDAPRLCARSAMQRISRIEKEWGRRICSRRNIDAVRSIVLSYL